MYSLICIFVFVVCICIRGGGGGQSIVSLRSSLIRQLVKHMLTTLSNPLLFFVGKILILIFSQQKITVDKNVIFTF